MVKLNEVEMAQLMRDALSGNQVAYGKLLKAIVPLVRGIVLAKAGGLSAEDREDILQDVLISIHAKKHTWRQDQPFRPWMFAVTRYKIIDVFRRRGRRVFVDIDDVADGLVAPEDDIGDQLDVVELVARLRGKQADVVRAIGLEGKSITDVAAQLGMKENAVRVNFHRGLEKLREFGTEEPNLTLEDMQ